MNKPTNFSNFIDALTDELIAMPDDEVLNGQDPKALLANAQALLKAAQTEAGRRRMATAKAAMAARKNSPIVKESGTPVISIAQARRFIAEAQNDPRYTMAARNLAEMTDEDVFRLYQQIRLLEGRSLSDSSINK